MKTKIKRLLGALLPLLAITTMGQTYSKNPDGSATVQFTSGYGDWPAWSHDKRCILLNRSTRSENNTEELNGLAVAPALSPALTSPGNP